METGGGDTSEGKKKRWLLGKLSEAWKDFASSRENPEISVLHFMPPSFRAAMKDPNITYVKTDGGDNTENPVLKKLMMQRNKPAQSALPISDSSAWRARLNGLWYQPIRPIVNPTSESAKWTMDFYKWHLLSGSSNLQELQKQHGFNPYSRINFDKDDAGTPVAEHMSSSHSRRDNFGGDVLYSDKPYSIPDWYDDYIVDDAGFPVAEHMSSSDSRRDNFGGDVLYSDKPYSIPDWYDDYIVDDAGSPIAEHTSSGDSRNNNFAMDVSCVSVDMGRDIPDTNHDDTSSEDEHPYQDTRDMGKPFRLDERNKHLVDKDDIGSPSVEHMSRSDSRRDNFAMGEASSVSDDMAKLDIPDTKHDDTSSEDEYPYHEFIGPYTREMAQLLRVDDRNQYLLQKNLNRQVMVLEILHMARVREFTDYDPKAYSHVPYRFYEHNITFFDFDKESKVEHGPLYHHHSFDFDHKQLDESINVISIKVAESDVPYPINIYGTVLARDQYDYRCVYLFKRGRDNPQLISSPGEMLTLTGPYRVLAGIRSMYFEFNLKIKGEGTVDQDFSKGFLERNPCRDSLEIRTRTLESYLSKVELEYMRVMYTLEASIGVNIFLDGKFNFMGKIAAWTTQKVRNKKSRNLELMESRIILYDSEVTGTETKLGNDGAVSLTRHVVAVPQNEYLVIDVSFYDDKSCHSFCLENNAQVCTFKVGPYELEFKIIWKEVRRRRPDLWRYISGIKLLCGIEDT